MEATLAALGAILLKAIPTFLLVVFLFLYLKSVFFKPMEKILKARFDATEGARLSAQESLKRAEAKAAEYEAALRAARVKMYAENEKARKQLQEERAAAIKQARTHSDAQIAAAKESLEAETALLRARLEGDADELSEAITTAVLRRRVA